MHIKKNPLTPRQTAIRLLEHMEEDVTYADIIRQVRILQDIDQTMNDVELGGFEGDEIVEEARTEWESRRESEKSAGWDARSRSETPEEGKAPAESETPADWMPINKGSNGVNGFDGVVDSLLRRAAWRH